MRSFRDTLVNAIYADHGRSRSVRTALSRCLSELERGGVGINVGEAARRLHPRIINVDVSAGPALDCCADATQLPFHDGAFALAITQETLEHVPAPDTALQELFRVLRPGGILYCQLPFIIGYHPGPTDYWRFTREGIRTVVQRAGFQCVEIGMTVGPAVGFYRIAVEFIASLAALPYSRLYMPAKGAAAVALYPIKWLDPLMQRSAQADRICGGYYVIARRPQSTADAPPAA
jgi:SAM-dependent methyltransferase